MHSPLAPLLLLVLAASAGAAPRKKSSSEDFVVAPARDVVLWNQSQDGKINLQVSLKDVQIVALLNSDNSYDDSDDYDYSELEALINSTIAATSTTAKPSESEEVPSSTDDEPLLQLSEVLQLASEQDAKLKDANDTTTTVPVEFLSNGKPGGNITQLTSETKASAPSIYHREAPKRSAIKTPCAEDEVRDRIGRCRRKSVKPKRRRPTARLAYPLKLSLESLARGFRLARLSEIDEEES